MSFLRVAARSLHQRRVRLQDGVLERASLFPFFDRQGRVRALMLVWPAAAHICLLDHQPALARVGWLGEIEIRFSLAALRNVDAGSAASYAGLWHYDPWWVLRAPRFEGHSAVPLLKATNCVGRFLKLVHGCYFPRDLSRLEGVSMHSKTTSGLAVLDRTFTRFAPDLLPPRPVPAQPETVRRSWTLDPLWLRGDWHLKA